MTNETQIRQVGSCHVSNLHLSEWAASAALVSWRRTQTHQLSARRASFRSWRLLQWRFLSAQHQHCGGTKQTTKSSADIFKLTNETKCLLLQVLNMFPIWHTSECLTLNTLSSIETKPKPIHTSVKAQQSSQRHIHPSEQQNNEQWPISSAFCTCSGPQWAHRRVDWQPWPFWGTWACRWARTELRSQASWWNGAGWPVGEPWHCRWLAGYKAEKSLTVYNKGNQPCMIQHRFFLWIGN